MLKTSYVEDNLVCFSIFSILKVFFAFENLYFDFKFPFAPRFVFSGPVERSVWAQSRDRVENYISTIVLTLCYGEKPDRSSANHIAGFTRKPDWKKINICNLLAEITKRFRQGDKICHLTLPLR